MAKKRYLMSITLLTGILAAGAKLGSGQNTTASAFESTPSDRRAVIERTEKLLEEVRLLSYPELDSDDIEVKTLKSRSDFFNARFSFTRFLTFRRLKTSILVNPVVFRSSISDTALKAILAHELAHALYYRTRNRLRLFGLVRLAHDGFEAKFERRTDLIAISRGYGNGLIEYRRWLYKNVSAKDLKAKQRNYFTPDEIDALTEVLKRDKKAFNELFIKVPRSLAEIQECTKTAVSD